MGVADGRQMENELTEGNVGEGNALVRTGPEEERTGEERGTTWSFRTVIVSVHWSYCFYRPPLTSRGKSHSNSTEQGNRIPGVKVRKGQTLTWKPEEKL